MILELNASDERGIDVVRNEIKSFASSRTLFTTGMKLIILDEADAMTNTAQFALRRVIEKYTKSTRFCLICNYINKIIPALQSRCTRFRFGPLDTTSVQARLEEVVTKEGVKMGPGGMDAVIRLARGDMRRCLNVLQACHLAYPAVDEESVYLCTGNPLPSDMKDILSLLFNESLQEANSQLMMLHTAKGLSLVDILVHLHDLLLRVKLPPMVLAFLLDKMSDIEYRLACGTTEKLQLGSLVASFNLAKEMVVAEGAKVNTSLT